MPRTYEHNRRSLRLKDYDYSEAGAYFVTVCTQGHTCLFGQAIDNRIQLNDAGEMVTRWWEKIPSKFPSVEIDTYVAMPNHFHGILVFTEGFDAPEQGGHVGPPLRRDLPGVIQWFKTMTTNEYIRGVKQLGWPAFNGKLWQWTYYEHIIRTEQSLNLIREYIAYNPQNWHQDENNPDLS